MNLALESGSLIKRPWGGYSILKKSQYYWIKKLFVNKNARLSLQKHRFRNEIWFVVKGKLHVDIGEKHSMVKTGDLLFVPKNTKHRITGETNAEVLEVAFGKVLESDIIRYQDDYGRARKNNSFNKL